MAGMCFLSLTLPQEKKKQPHGAAILLNATLRSTGDTPHDEARRCSYGSTAVYPAVPWKDYCDKTRRARDGGPGGTRKCHPGFSTSALCRDPGRTSTWWGT